MILALFLYFTPPINLFEFYRLQDLNHYSPLITLMFPHNSSSSHWFAVQPAMTDHEFHCL